VVEVLEALAAFLLAIAVFIAGAAALTSYSLRYSLRRANRLVPGREGTAAPLHWLWSPGAAAMMHRRLRSACKLASAVPGAWIPAIDGVGRLGRRRARRSRRRPGPQRDGIAQLARDVLEQALQLDGEIVTSSWLARGQPRARALAQLDHRVGAVEDAARRVHQLAAQRARLAETTELGPLSLQERIAAMEAAITELTRPPRAGPHAYPPEGPPQRNVGGGH
jgi:hypothetical protein